MSARCKIEREIFSESKREIKSQDRPEVVHARSNGYLSQPITIGHQSLIQSITTVYSSRIQPITAEYSSRMQPIIELWVIRQYIVVLVLSYWIIFRSYYQMLFQDGDWMLVVISLKHGPVCFQVHDDSVAFGSWLLDQGITSGNETMLGIYSQNRAEVGTNRKHEA